MARVTKDPDERRSELIACAQRLFYAKGYESTSVSDIVDEVGVAKGTFYYYFGSKLAILEALVDELVEQSVALLHEIVADETLPVLEKWAQAFQAVGTWKAERKDEMLAILHVMQMDENLLLAVQGSDQDGAVVVARVCQDHCPGCARKRCFKQRLWRNRPESRLPIVQSLSDPITDVLLNPDNYQDPAATCATQIRRRRNSRRTRARRATGARWSRHQRTNLCHLRVARELGGRREWENS